MGIDAMVLQTYIVSVGVFSPVFDFRIVRAGSQVLQKYKEGGFLWVGTKEKKA
jgi:hypothetical protein